MCYSSEASIGAFIFSLILSYLLFKRNKNNDRSIAILIFGLSFMQIAEFFMHLDPDCKSGYNKYASYLGMLTLLVIQPLFSILSNYNTQKKIFTKEIILQIILCIFYIFYMVKYFWPKSSDWCSKKNCIGDCKLTWNWWKINNDYIVQLLYMLIVLIIPIYVMYKLKYKAFIWLLYILLSVIFIYTNKYFNTLWCFWAPMGAFLLQYFLIY